MYKTLSLILILIATSASASALWQSTLKNAKGKTVRLALWGGSENINNWIDSYVKDEVKKLYDINLVRIPLTDTQIAIQKLIKEKKLKKRSGSIDLLWVNGENFKIMKDKKLTWRPYLRDLPNSKYIDMKSSNIMKDFGVDHNGLENPWGAAQMVYIYDSAKVKTPPKSLNELKKWIVENPGKFTYPSPPDFTGSAFIRQLLMNMTPKETYNKLLSGFDQELINKESSHLWNFLKEINPYLYKSGKYYPENVSKMHQLFSDGKVWITMDYYPTSAKRQMDKGVFPKTTRTFVLKEGSLSNTHFLSIPFNAPTKSSALVLANFLMGPKAQASKQDPKNWGDFTVLEMQKLNKKDRKLFSTLDLGVSTLPIDTLNKSKASELPAKYVPYLEKKWRIEINK